MLTLKTEEISEEQPENDKIPAKIEINQNSNNSFENAAENSGNNSQGNYSGQSSSQNNFGLENTTSVTSSSFENMTNNSGNNSQGNYSGQNSSQNNNLSNSFENDNNNQSIEDNNNNYSNVDESEIKKILKSVFRLSSFRTTQLEIIKDVLNKKDCVVIMPTGGGKSLCYQLPAVMMDGICFVISPLIALMQDQVYSLKEKGVAANFWNSSQKLAEIRAIEEDLKNPNLPPKTKLLYVTPELLATDKFSVLFDDLCERGLVSFIAVDECHCISSWGHDFRPKYRTLKFMLTKHPQVPILALTATATPKVRADVVSTLNMKAPRIFISSFNRPEISYEVRYKDGILDPLKDLILYVKNEIESYAIREKPKIQEVIKKPEGPKNALDLLMKSQSSPPSKSKPKKKDKPVEQAPENQKPDEPMIREGCGIVYCKKREDVDMMARNLQLSQIRAEPYHAGMTQTARKDILEKWTRLEIDVIVATIAFGMGIDKENVRFVIHWTVPGSLEGFYQESGRAGRDRNPAKSIVYYSDDEKSKQIFLMKQGRNNNGFQSDERLDQMLYSFQKMCDYCVCPKCRRKAILEYFGEIPNYDICQKTCDYCQNPSDVEKRLTPYSQILSNFLKTRSFTDRGFHSSAKSFQPNKSEKLVVMNDDIENFDDDSGSSKNRYDADGDPIYGEPKPKGGFFAGGGSSSSRKPARRFVSGDYDADDDVTGRETMGDDDDPLIENVRKAQNSNLLFPNSHINFTPAPTSNFVKASQYNPNANAIAHPISNSNPISSSNFTKAAKYNPIAKSNANPVSNSTNNVVDDDIQPFDSPEKPIFSSSSSGWKPPIKRRKLEIFGGPESNPASQNSQNRTKTIPNSNKTRNSQEKNNSQPRKMKPLDCFNSSQNSQEKNNSQPKRMKPLECFNSSQNSQTSPQNSQTSPHNSQTSPHNSQNSSQNAPQNYHSMYRNSISTVTTTSSSNMNSNAPNIRPQTEKTVPINPDSLKKIGIPRKRKLEDLDEENKQEQAVDRSNSRIENKSNRDDKKKGKDVIEIPE